MEIVQESLRALCDRALELGAARASLLPAQDVVVDERARFKCLVPRCINYGKSMCPPNVLSVDEFRHVLARYEHTLLIQVDMGRPVQAMREDPDGGQTLATLAQTPGNVVEATASFKAFYALIGRLEAEAFKLGFRFAAGLSFGNYREALDREPDGKCHEPPFTARPSMEAMGIDVVETARRAGLPISFAADAAPCYTGVILVD